MSYEQPVKRGGRKKKDGFHEILVERKPSTMEMDCQIPRFKRMGYEIVEDESSNEFVKMRIPQATYDQRAKDREAQTTQAIKTPIASGLSGEFQNSVEVTTQSADDFFDGVGDD